MICKAFSQIELSYKASTTWTTAIIFDLGKNGFFFEVNPMARTVNNLSYIGI